MTGPIRKQNRGRTRPHGSLFSYRQLKVQCCTLHRLSCVHKFNLSVFKMTGCPATAETAPSPTAILRFDPNTGDPLPATIFRRLELAYALRHTSMLFDRCQSLLSLILLHIVAQRLHNGLCSTPLIARSESLNQSAVIFRNLGKFQTFPFFPYLANETNVNHRATTSVELTPRSRSF